MTQQLKAQVYSKDNTVCLSYNCEIDGSLSNEEKVRLKGDFEKIVLDLKELVDKKCSK